MAVDRGDHVARLDAGLGSRAVGLRLGDQRAFAALHAEALGNLGRDRLDVHADPAAAHDALVLELRDHGLHRVGGNVEGNAHRAAGGREDGGVDPDDVTVHVEGRAAGIALVDGRVDLNKVVVGAGADV